MGDAPTYEELFAEVAERLGPDEAAHSVAVGETARELARIYDVDAEEARTAGLLHDWAREMSGEELLVAAQEYGISVAPVDRTVPYLLHARVGAQQLETRFPTLSKDVIRAVELHTMGAPEMSPLDKVVYVADMIEPSRTFKGVGKLRDTVGDVELDELFMSAYARSLSHLLRKRRRVHPMTVEVWNAMVAKELA